MREIKFRAWDNDKKMFIYSYNQQSAKEYGLPLGSSIHTAVFNIGNLYNTLEQYTGLKDRNGKEIYEGDIVDYSNTVEHGTGIIESTLSCINFHCRWTEQFTTSPTFSTSLDYLGCSSELEVIGNIHENTA